MAFTDEQNEQIRNDLIREAQRCGITIGMRKTSVEQLTEAVGISKGSFYKFFDSKELLFFAVLEDIHTECFAAAQKSLQENAAIDPASRTAAAILAACQHRSARQRRFWPSAGGCPIPETWFSLNMTPSCFYRDCRRASKRNITTMTRRTFVCFWKNMALFLNGGFHLPPRQYADLF